MTLSECRQNIDRINLKILNLLNERARWALEIRKLKQQQGLPVHQPSREEQILKEMQAKNEGPLGNQAIKRIFEKILAESRKLQTETYANQPER